MAAPAFLTKEYGPFTGTVWVVVIVGGVGLGLLMRRYMAGRGGDSTTDISGVSGGVGGVSSGSPFNLGGGGGGTLYNQGEIVQGVLEAIDAQKPPPAETRPEVDTSPPMGVIAPTPTSPPIAPESAEVVRIRSAILGIFKEEGLPPPDPARLDRLTTEVIQGRTLADIRAGLRRYKSRL